MSFLRARQAREHAALAAMPGTSAEDLFAEFETVDEDLDEGDCSEIDETAASAKSRGRKGHHPAAHKHAASPSRSASRASRNSSSSHSTAASAESLKRTRSLGFFSSRPLSLESLRSSWKSSSSSQRTPDRVQSAGERASLTRKAAQVLGVDLEGNVLKNTGRKRFSLNRRSFSTNNLF